MNAVEKIDRDIRRYHGRSFGYYFWRTSWSSVLLLALVVGIAVMLNWWWYWLLIIVLNGGMFARHVRAAHRAWVAMQEAGESMHALLAVLIERAALIERGRGEAAE